MANNENHEKAVAFGMTERDIAETAAALAKHKDNNHPSITGSYADFLAVKKVGHEALLAQDNYGKIDT